eukprot:3147493-Rhodomonas_salina.1
MALYASRACAVLDQHRIYVRRGEQARGLLTQRMLCACQVSMCEILDGRFLLPWAKVPASCPASSPHASCPVLTSHSGRRACYAVPAFEVAYWCHTVPGTDVAYRYCAMPGTDAAYRGACTDLARWPARLGCGDGRC